MRDSDMFFGREVETRLLLEHCDRLFQGEPGTRVLIVHGMSGAGKSSLVNAGLLPALSSYQRQRLGWRQSLIRMDDPGFIENPDRALSRAIEGVLIREEPLPPHLLVRGIVVLDQFESVLGEHPTEKDEDHATKVLGYLHEATGSSRNSWLLFVLCVAEPYHVELQAQFPNAGLFHVATVPSEDGLRQIVTKTLQSTGLAADADLADLVVRSAVRLAHDADRQAPILPLLSLALESLRLRWVKLVQQSGESVATTLGVTGYADLADLSHVIDVLGERAWESVRDQRIEIRRYASKRQAQVTWSDAMVHRLVDEAALSRLLRRLIVVDTSAESLARLRLRVITEMDSFLRQSTWLISALAQHRLLLRNISESTADGSENAEVLALVHPAVVSCWNRAAKWYAREAKALQTVHSALAVRARYYWSGGRRAESLAVSLEEYQAVLSAYEQLGEDLSVYKKAAVGPDDSTLLDVARLILAVNASRFDGMEANIMHIATFTADVGMLRLVLEHGANSNVDVDGWFLLEIASQRGGTDLVEVMLRYRANPNLTGQEGPSLSLASRWGHAQIVTMLLNAGADVDANDHMGVTPLMLSAAFGHAEIVEALLTAGANVNALGTAKQTALSAAISERQWHIALRLLDAGADPTLGDGRLSVSGAVQGGEEELVKRLVRAGADVNYSEGQVASPLLLAIFTGQHQLTRYLLAAGGSHGNRSESGATPLMIAAQGGDGEICELLFSVGAEVNAQANDGTTALILAAQNGHVAVVDCLLAAGANLELEANDGSTALLKSVQFEYPLVFERLIAAGASTKHRDKSGQTALTYAVQKPLGTIFDRLEAEGEDIDAVSYRGHTPLAIAAEHGALEACRRLIAMGAKVCGGANGVAPIWIAAQEGYDEVVSFLRTVGGADCATPLNADDFLNTAVMNGNLKAVQILLDLGCEAKSAPIALLVAAERGWTEIAVLLLEQGANPNARGIGGSTPLRQAVQGGSGQIIAALLDFGADPHLVDDNGCTPADVAIALGRKDLAALLLSSLPKDLPFQRADMAFVESLTSLDSARGADLAWPVSPILQGQPFLTDSSIPIGDAIDISEQILKAGLEARLRSLAVRFFSLDWLPGWTLVELLVKRDDNGTFGDTLKAQGVLSYLASGSAGITDAEMYKPLFPNSRLGYALPPTIEVALRASFLKDTIPLELAALAIAISGDVERLVEPAQPQVWSRIVLSDTSAALQATHEVNRRSLARLFKPPRIDRIASEECRIECFVHRHSEIFEGIYRVRCSSPTVVVKEQRVAIAASSTACFVGPVRSS
jgi:ankyrin repeat protein